MNLDSNLAILLPLIVNVLTVAFLFGGVIQKIKALEGDFNKLQRELEKIKDGYIRSEDNLHRVEIMLSRIEARFDMFLGAMSETVKYPMTRTTDDKIAGTTKS